MNRIRPFRILPLALAVIVAASCGDDDEDILGTDDDLEVTVTPAALTLQAGSSESVTVRVVRNGASGTVTVSAEGLPTGVTAEMATIAATQDTTTLTLTAAGTAEAGTGDVTIRATAGSEDATADLALTVTAAPAGSFLFTFEADSLDVVRGTPDTMSIVITREGVFTGPVTFATEGLPTGLTATFTADTVAGDTAFVSFAADTAVMADTIYPVAFTGSGTGVLDVKDTLFVTVVEPSSQSAALPLGPATLGTPAREPRVAAFTSRRAAEAVRAFERAARPERMDAAPQRD